MNDKCCLTCAGRDGYKPCPFDYCDGRSKPNGWNDHGNYCNEYSPCPESPGKIEPLRAGDTTLSDMFRKTNEIIEKWGPIIDALNRGKQ